MRFGTGNRSSPIGLSQPVVRFFDTIGVVRDYNGLFIQQYVLEKDLIVELDDSVVVIKTVQRRKKEVPSWLVVSSIKVVNK